MKKIYFIVALILLTLINYFLLFRPYIKEKTVRSIVLSEITPQKFIVVGKRLVDIEVSKAQKQEGLLNKFLFSHYVAIKGKVEVYYGYNLENNQIHISYDRKNACVQIDVPSPEVLTTHVIYPIEFTTKSGLLYKLFKEDKQKDLNDILAIFTQEAITRTQNWLNSSNGKEVFKEFVNFINKKANQQIVCPIN